MPPGQGEQRAASEDHGPVVVVGHDLLHDESHSRIEDSLAGVELVVVDELVPLADVLDRIRLAQQSLRRQDRRTGRHLQRRLAVSAQGERRAVRVQRIVIRVDREAVRVDSVRHVWRGAHLARHRHHRGNADAELNLDRRDVQRVAHASLKLARPVVAPVVVPWGVHLGRARFPVAEPRVGDGRRHRVLAARDGRGVGVDLHRRPGIARRPHGEVVLAAVRVRIGRTHHGDDRTCRGIDRHQRSLSDVPPAQGLDVLAHHALADVLQRGIQRGHDAQAAGVGLVLAELGDQQPGDVTHEGRRRRLVRRHEHVRRRRDVLGECPGRVRGGDLVVADHGVEHRLLAVFRGRPVDQRVVDRRPADDAGEH